MSEDNEIDSVEEKLGYLSYSTYLEEDSRRNKNKTASFIAEIGEDLLSEIDNKKQQQQTPKEKYVKYILKHRKIVNLMSYDFKDIVDIYNEVKKENQSFLSKAFQFIFFNKD